MTAGSLHREVDELLPWYANGTLEGEERARVEQHLGECQACRREMALLREVGDAAALIVQETPTVPDALGQTFARIDEWERHRPLTFGQRVRAFFQSLAPGPLPRLVLAGQAALIVVLGVALVTSRLEPTFTTASGGDGGATAGVRLTVTFGPAATEETMRQALRSVSAAFVAGPSAAGVYVVALPDDSTDAAVEMAVETLRRNSSVISFVEREP